ncbi:unnamed protein product [Effrenium voratum]|uniref:Uncharacterized protein n=1 Tax=Effrenium voratum TaxID=2562239 RepID=A0AA36IV24_9DINO|nr:unnamed protein product [Effrenium voratum]
MPLRLQRNGHALSSVWVPSRRASSASLRQHLLAPEATPEVGHPHEKEPEEKGRATEAPFEVGHPHENEPSEEKERPPAEEQPFEVVCAARSASSSSWSMVSGPQAEDANVQSEKDGQNHKDADLEAGASVKKTRSFIEGKHVHCFQLCCARMSCSWCLKMTIFLGFVQSTFLVGPLSRPLWIPISTQYAQRLQSRAQGAPDARPLALRTLEACEQNSDVGIPEAFAQHHDLASGPAEC